MRFSAAESRMLPSTGTTSPLILICTGEPAVKKMSEACVSAINLKSDLTNMASPSVCLPDIVPRLARRGEALIAAQELVDAGLGASLGVYLLHDHRAIEVVLAVRTRQRP